MIDIGPLHNACVAASAKVSGVSIGDLNDRSTWKASYISDPLQSEQDAVNFVLSSFVLPPPDPSAVLEAVAFKVLFNHENRIRVLEGKQAVTAAQFRTAIVAIIGP